MKVLRFLGMVLFAIVFSLGLMSCSNDDDDLSVSLSDTTWKVVSVDEEDFNVDECISFHADGTATLSAHSWIPIKWKLKGNGLVLDFDTDYTKGSFAVNGDVATYYYVWESTDDDSHYTMKLQKQP